MTDRDALKIGVVGLSGGWSTEALADALEERTGYRLVVEMDRVVLDASATIDFAAAAGLDFAAGVTLGSAGGSLDYDGVDLGSLDGLVVKKLGRRYGPRMHQRLALLQAVQERGVRIFSPPARVNAILDRLSCTLGLVRAGIPMPPTVVTEDPKRAAETVRAFGRAVLKPLYSTKAEGMELVDASRDDVEAVLEHHRPPGQRVFYIQKQVELLDGRDLGCAFLGGEYLGTYARVSGGGSWNTTIRAGGHYAPFDPDPEVVDLARRAKEPFGLDFTGVDIALTPDGPVVFEVSAFGGYRGLQEGLEIDAAARVADYAVAELRGARG